MEKAVLKTLNYPDISKYPMKAYEIHKWLIGKKGSLYQVEKALASLIKKRKVESLDDYYFLPKRKFADKKSIDYGIRIWLLAYILKILPSIKLVGISERDNIRLTIVTENKSMSLLKILMNFLGINIKENKKLKQTSGKNLQNALKILQMNPIWQRDGIYSEYLLENEWVFRFFPNWITKD